MATKAIMTSATPAHSKLAAGVIDDIPHTPHTPHANTLKEEKPWENLRRQEEEEEKEIHCVHTFSNGL